MKTNSSFFKTVRIVKFCKSNIGHRHAKKRSHSVFLNNSNVVDQEAIE